MSALLPSCSMSLFTALLLGAQASSAQTFSGKVVGTDGLAKSGITVSFKSGELVLGSATTGTDGTWSLEPSTSATSRERAVTPGGNLLLDGNRQLRVSFAGRDINGRRSGLATSNLREGMAGMATAGRTARSAAVPDTLVYSLGDRVFLRDTLSTLAASGIERVFDTTWNAAIVYGYLKDSRDSRIYRTVKVGSQVWMAQNLAFKRDTSWILRDSLELGERYGRLYQWASAMDTSAVFLKDVAEIQLPWRGACPQGWHVPSDAEWSILVNQSDSTTSGAKLKALSFAVDTSKAAPQTDAWGFRVLDAGFVSYNQYAYRNVFMGFPGAAVFWTASEYTTLRSWSRSLTDVTNSVVRKSSLKTEGYSVRCIQD